MGNTNHGEVKFDQPLNIHIVGIGGAGMSAIAEVLAGKGHTVSGSDLEDSELLASLTSRGITVSVGHDAKNLDVSVDLVTHSTAIPKENPELVEAHSRGLPVLRRAEALSTITKEWKTIAVAGTHGKTTTSAMLTIALIGSGLDPSYIVGGNVKSLGRGAAVGAGEFLVVEADESDGTFIELSCFGSLVTNVEPDHLEHYGNFDKLKDAFVQFVEQPEGPTVLCIDDPGAAELASRVSAVGYGVNPEADYQISDVTHVDDGVAFSITILDSESAAESYSISLKQPGMHNVLNASAAFTMAHLLGADPNKVAAALTDFEGVGRRFESRGSIGGIDLVDDYAHLPTEVEAALAAAKETKHDRVVAVFQPHRYSRTEQLWDTFGSSFIDADLLIVTGIYSSGEKPREGISGQLIADLVMKEHPASNIRYIPELSDVIEFLIEELRQGDLCMTLGAGDLTDIPDQVLSGIKNRIGG